MTEQPFHARLAFLTQPAPGVILFNLQIGETFQRVELTQRQLANILVDGAAIALKSEKMT